jgi:carboxyl-terminal processing protease
LSKHKKIILHFIIFLISPYAEGKINLALTEEKEVLCQEIFIKISGEHFFKNKDLSDLNLKVFNSLIDQLDSQKNYFTEYEIKTFKNKFQSYDSIKNQNKRKPSECSINIKAKYELINLYFNRLIEATNFQLKEIKKKKFDFTKNEEIIIDDEEKFWKKNKFKLKQSWKKMSKNDVLTSMLASNDLDEATSLIEKRYSNRLRRIGQRNQEDIFSLAMNNLMSIFDPHSSYFSPKSAEDFEMSMSLKLEGIGALLTTEDDYPVIVSVVPGGPAEKTRKINPDDKIVRIRQAEETNSKAIDVVGWRIDEVVQLIRGKAGTKVELELIPAKNEDYSERKFVTILREEVKLEEQAAKSKIIEINKNDQKIKIGIIDLPAFYIDFNAFRDRDPNFRSSSRDVKAILQEFNSKGIEGLIIDLRGNSGGSLYEANKLSGLFVSAGATLQVKQSNGGIRPWGQVKAEQIWKKPMAVMVDRYSASASEIFAGAIQDYQRGIIIGHRTFGKGTVQALEDLSEGQIKITESKFYRVTGSGMQNEGIYPDIELPSTWDIEEVGESSLDEALHWDEIKPLRFEKFYMQPSILPKLKEAHLKRIEDNPNLQYILDIRRRYESQKDKNSLSLNLMHREIEKREREEWALKTENKRRLGLDMEIFDSYEDFKEFNESEDEKKIEIDFKNDYLLIEGAEILGDYMFLSRKFILSKAA